MEKKKLKTYYGFPLPHEEEEDKEKESSRGVALILAMFIISMVSMFLAEMIVTSAVSLRLAVAARNNVKAEYMAKSGANLGLFLIGGDLLIDLIMYQQSGVAGKNSSYPTDGPGDIWGMLNGFPIGGDTQELIASAAESFELSKVNDSGVIDQLALFDGNFVIEVTDEQNRINVNYLGGNTRKVETLLEALFSCPVEKEFLEEKDLDPKQLVLHIKNWMDENTKPEDGYDYSSEEEPYAEYPVKTGPKNHFFESLDELRMIPGWDQEMHDVFSPFLTVFPIIPSGKEASRKSATFVNFNTASKELLGCLLPKSKLDCNERSALYSQNRLDQTDIADTSSINSLLANTFCTSSKKKSQNFTFRSDVFRVEVTGTVGDQVKKLNTVIHRGMGESIDSGKDFKGAYKHLYWKML